MLHQLDAAPYRGSRYARVIYYRQVCKHTGLVWQDATRDPVDVPAPFASGLRAGSYAAFRDLVFEGGKELSLPLVVYKDKTAKHLVAFYGFPLE